MSEEQVESIFQHACEGAAESIGSTRTDWQRVVDAIRFLRRSRDDARKDAVACAAAHINAVAQLSEARRLLEASESLRSATISTMRRNEAELTDARRLLDDARALVRDSCPFVPQWATVLQQRYASFLADAAAPVPAQPAIIQHDSDCSLHNAPALPVGPCDCSKAQPAAAVSDICNAYESGVGHAGRPTAKVNPYREGTPEHEAYAIGASGTKHNGQPAAVPEAVAKDAARLDFLIAERAIVQNHIFTEGARFWVSWPVLGEDQRNLYKSPREAIDAAILSAADTEVKNGTRN